MKEVEAKILEVSRKEILGRLRKAGAKKAFSKKLDAIYFDFPNLALKKAGKVVRLRLEGKTAVLCVKVKRGKSRLKSLDEFETEVASFKEAQKMLNAMGLVEKKRYSKQRDSYRLKGAHVELEKIRGIPLYVEIEAGSEAKVLETAKLLGFKRKQLLSWNTFDVLKHYKKA